MSKRILTGVVAVVAAIVVLGGQTARATESRADALLYNMALQDDTDVFLFPNLLPQYNQITFYLPAAKANMYGGITFGGSQNAFGIYVHRPIESAFDRYRLGLGADAVPLWRDRSASGQVFDLAWGNNGFGLGLRVHGWSEASVQAPTGGTETENNLLADPAEPQNAIFVGLNLGFRIAEGANMRVNVGIRNVKYNGTGGMIQVGARYIQPGASAVKLVVAGEAEIGIWSPEKGDFGFGFALPLKAGVQVSLIPEKLTAGILAGIDIQSSRMAGDGSGRLGLAIPTFELATEYKPLSWLALRAAMKSGYGFELSKDAAKNHPKHEQLIFNSGLGFDLGPLLIDTALCYSLWQNGPYALGGVAGLFASATATYRW